MIHSRVYRGSHRRLYSRTHSRIHNRFSAAIIAVLLAALPGECSTCFAARFQRGTPQDSQFDAERDSKPDSEQKL